MHAQWWEYNVPDTYCNEKKVIFGSIVVRSEMEGEPWGKKY